MICYSLICSENHTFDSWFASADAYTKLKKSGHLCCSICGALHVKKAIMAPNVALKEKKKNIEAVNLGLTESASEKAIKELKKHVKNNSEDVGNNFALVARQMHEGEITERNIHGKTSLEEAKSLNEDGIPIIPLPWIDRNTN